VLILARHGQTQANADGLLLGRLDPPLTDVGRTQADALRSAVAGASRVVCSPLLRTRQTADALGLPVTVDERWIEVDYGIYDGRKLSDVPASTWDAWRSDLSFTPEGGESLAAVGRRVADACRSLADEARSSDVVVVTHVSPVKAAVLWALDAGDDAVWRLFVDVASVSRIAVTERGPVLRSFNETHHLPSPLPGGAPG
jgi:broad specificity phosphatase PhoE